MALSRSVFARGRVSQSCLHTAPSRPGDLTLRSLCQFLAVRSAMPALQRWVHWFESLLH